MRKFTEAYLKEHKKESDYLSYLLAEINAGENTLKQSKVNETLKIEDDWIETIYNYIFFVEQIVRKPTTFIRNDQEVVNIEKVRKVETDAVRHLAQHTNLIRKIEDDGMVQPKKLLNKQAEIEYAIYENRFVYTLLKRLNMFLNRRISDLEQKVGNFDVTSMSMISKFDLGGSEVTYDMDVKFRELPSDNALYMQNKTLMEKLYQVQARVRIMLNSEFGKILEKARPVAPPIKKTNLLRLNRYYNSAFKLWLFMQSFNAVGYSLVVEEKTLPFDQDYFDDLAHVVMDSVYTVITNNKDRKIEFDKVETVKRKPKKFKVVRKVDLELRKMDAPEAELVDKINQYYYDQIKNIVADAITAKDKDEEGDFETQEQNAEVSARQFYGALMELNDEMFDDIAESQKPEKLKNLPDEDAAAIVKKRHQRDEQRWICKNLKTLTTLKESDFKVTQKKLAAEEKRLKLLESQIVKIQEAEKARKIKDSEKAKKLKEAEILKSEEAKLKTRLEKEKAALKAEQAREAEKAQRAKDAEKAKLAAQKAKDAEKAKKAKEAERSKAAVQAQKEKEAERAKKAKEAAKAKETMQKAKEKEKARLAALKEKEKIQKAKEVEKAKKVNNGNNNKAPKAKEEKVSTTIETE